jgi:serine hydrolase
VGCRMAAVGVGRHRAAERTNPRKDGPVRRNAIIFHGTGGNPAVAWYPWLGQRLAGRGYAVEIPHYPELNVEPVATFLPKVLAGHAFDEQTVLVGHSGGAALLLAILERIEVTVAQAVLVAGYCTRPNTSDEPVLREEYDWAAIRAHVRDPYFINSRRDPYGCDDRQGRAMFDRVGGTQIVRDDGHFGDHDQAYDTFDLVDRIIT